MPTHHPVVEMPAAPSRPREGYAVQKPSDLRFDRLPPGTTTVAILLGVGVAAFFVAVFLLGTGEARANGKVEAWAQANGYEVVKTLVVKRDRGPFKARAAWQTVSAVTVRTRQGMNRSAWICWGNLFFLYYREPTVQWDEQAGKRAS